MKSRLINYEQLEALFSKHDVDASMPKALTAKLFEKIFIYISTVFLVLLGVTLFVCLLPLIIIESLIVGIYRGIKNAKKVSD